MDDTGHMKCGVTYWFLTRIASPFLMTAGSQGREYRATLSFASGLGIVSELSEDICLELKTESKGDESCFFFST